MIKELTINGQDSRKWGVVLDEKSLSVLMTPPPNKEDVANKSRLQHGSRPVNLATKKDERDITITIGICAESRSDFYLKYHAFCQDVLTQGDFYIETVYQPDVIYKCRYKRCEPITYFNGQIGRFSLLLNEPNPDDRTKGEYIEQ